MTMSRMRITLANVILVAGAGVVAGGASSLQAQTVGHGVAAALLNVVQYDTNNTTFSVLVTTTLAVNEFSIRDGSNRGDYNVQIGAGFSDDVSTGVIMTSVAQNGRDNGEVTYPGTNFCTSAIDYSRSGANAGAYYISTFNAPSGAEYNINVAAAFFSYTDWMGGLARNSGDTNGGANDLFTGSPGLVLGTHFVDNGGGISTLNLTNFGVDSRTSGVLLVTHGKNEDNYAMSQVNSNNGTWTIYIKDNGTDAGSYEQDPVAFVFIPKTNTAVISGRFRGDGTPLMFSGATPQFSVTNTSAGTWRLTIPGYTPASGVLILSAEGGLSQNQDNIVSYQPDAAGWIIQSRDLPASPPGLQTPGAGLEPVASFVFIPAAATINLVSPANNVQGLGTSPALQVSVSNTVPGNLTVKFYARVAASNPSSDFAIVALPDTQFYVSSLNGGVPEMFYAQAEWIITNRVSRNIAYVAQLGDLSQNGDIKSGSANTAEWRNGTNAMYRLENPTRTLLAAGIPYGVAVGNHDEEPIGDSTGTTTYYNQYFGISHFAGKPYYAGHYAANNNNHFDFFSAGGMDFIVVYLQYDETLNPVWLNWANDVLRTNANRRAIIITHNFGGTTTPVNFSPQGSAIYNAIKTNKNVFMMLSGHVTGEGSRVDTYNGHTVRTFVSDYQGWTNGGNGYMRIIDFSPSNNQVVFTTYSPWVDEYQTGPTSELWFPYDMQQPGGTNFSEFAMIGVSSNVTSGSVASLAWPGRQYNTAYEWYIAVTDEFNNTTVGPVWRFATAPNLPPTVANMSRTIIGDSLTNLTLVATDPNNDPLTFQTQSSPTHGLLKNVNLAAGIVTYSPTRGYRGSDRFTFSASDGQYSTTVATMNLNVVAPPDTNGNGLPDSWEATYGVTDPNADDDGDGRSNLDEYFANTNPTNAASVLQITTAVRQTNGYFGVTWSSVGGTRYRVQFANDITSAGFGGAFTDIVRNLTNEMDAAAYGAASTQSFTDDFTLTGAPANGVRYYRIKVVP